jgi:alkanesulfonate monooxygenase SsuD/methylene tetrahydromethanopterin reductase-like flavin-dependent oxidoreductase (luciferase family)
MKKFGILDFGSIVDSQTNTIEQTISFAQEIEKLGYTRLWLTEHYDKSSAWKSPDIFLSILAGYTENIKIGTAGISLKLNTALKTAYTYKFLSTLFPNRIDLGISKGTASPSICKELLNGQPNIPYSNNDHNTRVTKLCNFLAANQQESHII